MITTAIAARIAASPRIAHGPVGLRPMSRSSDARWTVVSMIPGHSPHGGTGATIRAAGTYDDRAAAMAAIRGA